MNEQIQSYINKPFFIPTVVGVLSGAAGFATGYFVSNRRQTVVVPDEPQEIEGQLGFFSDVEAAIAADKELETWSYPVEEEIALEEHILDEEAELMLEEDELAEAIAEAPVQVANVFENPADEWDYEAELATRNPENSYVIHLDEWVLNELGYQQDTCTYYAGDDIMVDGRDTPIYNHHEIFGDLKFGYGSDDPSVVYIRNERLTLEWEVFLHTGRYEVEVLGHSIEEDYAMADSKPQIPKFREE